MKLKLILFFIGLNSLLFAQTRMIGNYFLPTELSNLKGAPDSLVLTNYDWEEGDTLPRIIKTYVFENNKTIKYSLVEEYNIDGGLSIQGYYENNKLLYEIINHPFLELDSNKYIYDDKNNLLEIRNIENYAKLSYDSKNRIKVIEYGLTQENVITNVQTYTYYDNNNYSISETDGANVYLVQEFKNNLLVLETRNSILGGSDISIFEYNKNNDLKSIHTTGSNNLDIKISFKYQYDAKNNWVKCQAYYQQNGEQPYLGSISERYIVYCNEKTTRK